MPLILVLETASDLWDVCWQLLRIGYDLPKGWLAGGMMSWRTAAKELEFMPLISVRDLKRQLQEVFVLDVRQKTEWRSGHIKAATHITGAELPKRYKEVPKEKTVAVICGSGYRSSVNASLLKHHGYKDVVNVLGGMTAWKNAGLETVKDK